MAVDALTAFLVVQMLNDLWNLANEHFSKDNPPQAFWCGWRHRTKPGFSLKSYDRTKNNLTAFFLKNMWYSWRDIALKYQVIKVDERWDFGWGKAGNELYWEVRESLVPCPKWQLFTFAVSLSGKNQFWTHNFFLSSWTWEVFYVDAQYLHCENIQRLSQTRSCLNILGCLLFWGESAERLLSPQSLWENCC